MKNYDLTAWYIQTLTGSVDTVIDWRCIHDKRKDLPAHTYRGTLAEMWSTLESYNDKGYGIFCTINALDGQGRELSNVQHIRAHVVDLDNTMTAQMNYDRAVAAGASFAVQSSPGKFHVYWRVEPYTGNDFYTLMQKKFAQLYDGDKSIIDATRVMRVPGFLHLKGEPQLVTGWPLANVDQIRTAQSIQDELAAVNVIESFSTRSPLGEPTMVAPSLDWLRFAVSLVDPNDMDRGEWLSMSAAIKQSGWNLTDPETLLQIWSEWCDRYSDNDAGENLKLWNSINDTEVGWSSIERKSPVKAYMMFGFKDAPTPQRSVDQWIDQTDGSDAGSNPAASTVDASQVLQQTATNAIDTSGEILSEYECQEWFKNVISLSARVKYLRKVVLWVQRHLTVATAVNSSL